ncbi:MAG: hypothetical protein EP326_09760 [Deltaproteobacteria bacterium]|jgi:hypothetical protein|nr:MAG: hypothetical protein EP326_09760 [Deltaproteobacteria bacterium]TNF26006.1 MAG: hypothetical protein EP319_14970 [Deltaproteobacteria bacterium]
MKRFIFALLTSILGLVLQMVALTMGAIFIDPKVALFFSISFLLLLFASNLIISWGSSFVLQRGLSPAPVKKKKLPPTPQTKFIE